MEQNERLINPREVSSVNCTQYMHTYALDVASKADSVIHMWRNRRKISTTTNTVFPRFYQDGKQTYNHETNNTSIDQTNERVSYLYSLHETKCMKLVTVITRATETSSRSNVKGADTHTKK